MSELISDLTDTIKAIRQKRLQKEDTVMSRALTRIKELEDIIIAATLLLEDGMYKSALNALKSLKEDV